MKGVREILARAAGRKSSNPSGRDVVLSVDIGTTRSKGVLLDREANVVASASIRHLDAIDQMGHHEHDAENIWWHDFVTLVRSMLQSAQVPSAAVKCICVTGLFPCFCPTDYDGVPLHPALLYDDNRAVEYVRRIYPGRDSAVEGNELAGRIAWFRAEHPQRASKLRRVFSCHNYIVFRLTGRYCVDGHTAFLFGSVFDPAAFSWDDQELARVGVDSSLLPEILAPEELAGHVHIEASRATGLSVGTPVIAGTGDIFASLLGSGATERGDVFAYYGTTSAIIELTQSADFLFNSRAYRTGDDGVQWRTAFVRSGERFESLLRITQLASVQRESMSSFQSVEEGVNPSKANWSSALYFPQTSLTGEFNTVSPSLAGFFAVPLGMSAGDIYRTMVEGLGYMIRYSLEGGHTLDIGTQWYATGGGANSKIFCQLISDALSHTHVVLPNSDTAIGGAIAAGHFSGFFTYDYMNGKRKSMGRVFSPQDQLRGDYDRRYNSFVSAYNILQNMQ